MSSIILLIKNMVCQRCVTAVEDILRAEAIEFQQVLFGEIHLYKELTDQKTQQLTELLNKIGFEVIDNQSTAIIEKIKKLVIQRARNEMPAAENRIKLSLHISNTVHHEYTYLSGLFSAVEGRTIENYFIEQRIEKAKELLVYGELTLSQISDELEYSGVAHLSTQFKKITGLTPSYFKELGTAKRRGLDKV